MAHACVSRAFAPRAASAGTPLHARRHISTGSGRRYDYVVVGGGSAGCVLARRLAERHRDRSVLLLEAGPDDSVWRQPWLHIPVGYYKTTHNPSVGVHEHPRPGLVCSAIISPLTPLGGFGADWCFDTEPDPGLAGRATRWPRGKVLGGPSSLTVSLTSSLQLTAAQR